LQFLLIFDWKADQRHLIAFAHLTKRLYPRDKSAIDAQCIRGVLLAFARLPQTQELVDSTDDPITINEFVSDPDQVHRLTSVCASYAGNACARMPCAHFCAHPHSTTLPPAEATKTNKKETAPPSRWPAISLTTSR